ncbi:MAG: dTDP-4-dehydrorhamnose 3,5-epimerase [Ignavibacteriae bacterium]|nr:MAG: dTDP-4-dehydrorhamnose 3,5-epimerase [Ignavibacteriota bacterium]
MRVTDELLNGVLLIEIDRYRDERGYFEELYHADELRGLGIHTPFVQDNHSRSTAGVVRGLHYQHTEPQGKLLTVLQGAIQLVELDLRAGSATFGRHVSVMLSDERPQLVWIPPGFANGFCCVSDVADVLYKCTSYYNASGEGSIDPLDPDLGITWDTSAPILSTKDRTASSWTSYTERPTF